MLASLIALVAGLVLAPLLLGVVNRTKALFAGRRGPPLLQGYRDLNKLLGKGEVRSTTTTWVFAAGPLVGLGATVAAALLVPQGAAQAVVAFPGDLVLFAYLFGLGRFLLVSAALDTGSAFEGMGASREVLYAALAEPALFIALAGLARRAGSLSLSGILEAAPALWSGAGPEIALVVATLAVVLMAENARIPFDDPTTHLELTMIHEVMVLDHSGPLFAAVEYTAALKLWVQGSLLVGLLVPLRGQHWGLALAAQLGGMLLLGVAVGVVESTRARLRLPRVPQLLVGAAAMGAVALALSLR